MWLLHFLRQGWHSAIRLCRGAYDPSLSISANLSLPFHAYRSPKFCFSVRVRHKIGGARGGRNGEKAERARSITFTLLPFLPYRLT